jgi:hypothetical protein
MSIEFGKSNDPDGVGEAEKFVLTMLSYIGIDHKMIAKKFHISEEAVTDARQWIEEHRPDMIADITNTLIPALPNDFTLERDADELLNETAASVEKVEAMLASIRQSQQRPHDDPKPLSAEEESVFKDLAGQLSDLETSSVSKEAHYLQAASIIDVEWVSRPSLGGHLYGQNDMVTKFLQTVNDDIDHGMYKLRSSRMALAVSTTIVNGDQRNELEPAVLMSAQARADWLFHGGESRKTTNDEDESMRIWLQGLQHHDPEAMAYVSAIQLPIGLHIDNDGVLGVEKNMDTGQDE